MLTLCDSRPDHHCQGYSRRDFLRIGSLALGGLTLSSLLGVRASAGEVRGALTGKSVVLLFLQGGPPHIEFFDPKMTAPPDVHSINGEVKTVLPGVTFGATFPKLAAMADKLAVVRSYGSNNAEHSYQKIVSGNNATKPAMGALYSRVATSAGRDSAMPPNVLILPESIDPTLKQGKNFMRRPRVRIAVTNSFHHPVP